MLSTQQKSQILKKAGRTAPAMPAGNGPELDAWKREIENLYVSYVAARAARSLRESEEAAQLDRLRNLALRVYASA
ncbi:hypothetical protein [Variovorax sp. OV329]|uniref:hypothetical protein n=1 Tax=Variovorax sp. OV329 TaxID=1882825 RepID=UPI0008DF7588|nr:hypothetical protein [Variovorax sp. OV329]SFM55696.1 hypothetical protein SAMN05444747_106201 [Variovorax sp. OV329]